MISDPNSIHFYLEKAFNLAISGRPGPVFLDIPADIQNALIDENKLPRYKYKNKINTYKIDKEIQTIVSKLKNSKCPLIHLGHGVKLSGAKKIIQKFFNKNKIPFLLTWNADDIISSNHEMYFGRPGAFGERGSNFIVQNCDFYLSIGTRLPYMVTGYNAKKFASKAKFKVMVDVDKNELKKDIKIDLKVQSDAKIFLEKLLIKIKNYKHNNKWINYCRSVRKKYPILLDKMIKQKKYVNSYYFVKTLSKVSGLNDTIVTDMGFSFTSTHQAIEIKKNQKFYTNSGHAPMGWGLPAAIGAFFSKKNKNSKVICLTGDGGFQMNIQELATVMHNKLPIKIFIFNNEGYLTIKQTQILGFNGRIMGADKNSGLSFPNYKLIAKSHGIDYLKVDNQINLINKIKLVMKKKAQLFVN